MNTKAALRTLTVLSGAAIAASFASPAAAQSMPIAGGGAYSVSKTEAILGGPSALQQLMAQQNGGAAAVTPAAAPVRPTVELASYQRPAVLSAVLRDQASVSPGVSNGRPDVFGSVALRVGHTKLDARWHSVEYSPVSGSAASFAQSLRGEEAFRRLEAVNWYVNKRVHFVDDSVRWGRADVWSSANETLNSGRGDCEDFAIAKLQMARRAGFADRDLYLVIVRDLVRRADHAILVVRAAGHMYVLDNGTDQVLDSESISDYRPIFTFASNATFTHGYRVKLQPPVNIASLDTDAVAPAGRLSLR